MSTPSYTKQPTETRTYDVTFLSLLVTGETVSSVDSVTQRVMDPVTGARTATTDLTIVGNTLVTPVVSVQLSGGVEGVLYDVTVEVTASNGDIIEQQFRLYVTDL